jgi:flagella basal body P-ring formation protein FlgA
MSRWALFITAILATTVGFLAACTAHAATLPVSLRGNQIHVTSDVVTLSDVFDGVTDGRDLQVATAPAPGKTILLDSGTLYSIAAANHIDWQPRGMNEKVIVIRDGDIVTGMPVLAGTNLQAVIAPLTPALAAKGAGDKLSVLLDAGEQQRLLSILPASTVLAVEALDFDPASRHFTATLVDTASGQRNAVAGRAIAMVTVPVPGHRINQGDMIRAEDIVTIDQRSDQLRSDTELNTRNLIGKVAKRQLEASLPVQDRFLGMPTIIKRGDRVTMIVKNGGIVLTAEGLATSDAGLGETVHLTNAATNKALDGIATGTNTAEVRTDATIIAASASAAGQTVTR